MSESRVRSVCTVRVDPDDPHRGRLWAYGTATVARLAGVCHEVVKRAVRQKRLDMGDVLAVADWIRMRKAGNTQISIAKRIGCKRGKVEAAIRRGELDMANPQSIERWIYDKSKAATKPNPGLPFAHYSLVRNHHHAHRSNLKVSQRRRGRGSIEELLHGLQSLGFKSAQRRGTGHVHMKPDIFSISDAERLRDVMHANGWKAGQLSVSARRWLIVFGAVQVPASLRRLLRTHHRGGTAAS